MLEQSDKARNRRKRKSGITATVQQFEKKKKVLVFPQTSEVQVCLLLHLYFGKVTSRIMKCH